MFAIVAIVGCSGSSGSTAQPPPGPSQSSLVSRGVAATDAHRLFLPPPYVRINRLNGHKCSQPQLGLLGCWSARHVPIRVAHDLARRAAIDRLPVDTHCGPPTAGNDLKACQVSIRPSGWVIAFAIQPVLAPPTTAPNGQTVLSTPIGSNITLTLQSS
jgi:hypothetical protein